MASTTEVEDKLRELIARLNESDPEVKSSLRDSVPEGRTLWLHLPDLEADYWTELEDGRMRGLHEGERDDADVRITVDSDHLIELIDGDTKLFPAYLSGTIRIEARFTDILQLRRML